MTTGTGIHSCTENKMCRKIIISVNSGNVDHLIFHRLPQNLQTSSGKLRHFIQKQHPSVCQSNFSWSGIPPASCQCLCRAGMMRTPKWSVADQGIMGRKKSCNAVDFGQFQPFFKRQGGHDPRNPSCHHGLPCTRWADHK